MYSPGHLFKIYGKDEGTLYCIHYYFSKQL